MGVGAKLVSVPENVQVNGIQETLVGKIIQVGKEVTPFTAVQIGENSKGKYGKEMITLVKFVG